MILFILLFLNYIYLYVNNIFFCYRFLSQYPVLRHSFFQISFFKPTIRSLQKIIITSSVVCLSGKSVMLSESVSSASKCVLFYQLQWNTWNNDSEYAINSQNTNLNTYLKQCEFQSWLITAVWIKWKYAMWVTYQIMAFWPGHTKHYWNVFIHNGATESNIWPLWPHTHGSETGPVTRLSVCGLVIIHAVDTLCSH